MDGSIVLKLLQLKNLGPEVFVGMILLFGILSQTAAIFDTSSSISLLIHEVR